LACARRRDASEPVHHKAEPVNLVNDANLQLLEARATDALIKAERERR
jgi:hypothetical protein